eukprot:tig00020531_g10044.t1
MGRHRWTHVQVDTGRHRLHQIAPEKVSATYRRSLKNAGLQRRDKTSRDWHTKTGIDWYGYRPQGEFWEQLPLFLFLMWFDTASAPASSVDDRIATEPAAGQPGQVSGTPVDEHDALHHEDSDAEHGYPSDDDDDSRSHTHTVPLPGVETTLQALRRDRRQHAHTWYIDPIWHKALAGGEVILPLNFKTFLRT